MAYISYNIPKPSHNTDPQLKEALVDAANDCYYENSGEGWYAIRRRPGSTLFLDPLAGEVGISPYGQGIFWSERFKAVFAVVNGRLFKVMDAQATHAEILGVTMRADRPVVFAEAQTIATVPYIYIAHGGKLCYTDGLALAYPSDVSTPENCTYVTFANARAFALNGGQDVWITDDNPNLGYMDLFYWSGSGNPYRAALRPDDTLAVFASWDEIAFMGSQSIEYWQEDGENPISPMIGATTEAGITAPYSLVRSDNTLFFVGDLDGKRAVFKMSERTPSILSGDIDRPLQEMSVVDDARGSLVFVGGLNMYVVHFPTAGKTWAYDIREGIWTEWTQWDSATSSYDPFPIIGSCYARAWNKHLFMTSDGKIYEFSRDLYQDNGAAIRTNIRTGWLSHGTAKRKRAVGFWIKVKCYSPTAGSLLMRWRDDGRPEWSPYLEIPVGSESQDQTINVMNRCGIYRSRQYEFMMSDNVDLAISGISEELLELRN